MAEERARADTFIQMCIDAVAEADQEHPIPPQERTKAMDREVVRLLNEAYLGMKDCDVSALVHMARAQRFMRLVQNLWHNWSYVKKRANQLNKLNLKYEKLQARTKLLEGMNRDMARGNMRKNGFQCADKVEAVRGLLEGLCVPMESGATREQHDQIQAARERGLSLIQDWQKTLGLLQSLGCEAGRDENPETVKALGDFFQLVKTGRDQRVGNSGFWDSVLNPKLEDVIFVAYVASLAVLLLVMFDVIRLLAWLLCSRL